jgi:hypothetical protein
MPENEDPKVPALSLKHLMRQREMVRKGIQTSREQNNALDYVQPGGQLNYTVRLKFIRINLFRFSTDSQPKPLYSAVPNPKRLT